MNRRTRQGSSGMPGMKVWIVGGALAATLALGGMLGCGSSDTGGAGSTDSPATGSSASAPAKPLLTLKGAAR
jgi:hypothetical protein